MTHPELLEKHRATPTPAGLAWGTARLPPDVLRDASKRLGWAGLIYSVAYFLSYFVGSLISVGTGAAGPAWLLERPFPTVVATVSIALGVVVFFASRSARLPAPLLLDLGLVFEVVASFGIAAAEFWGVYETWGGFEALADSYVGISWVAAWILVFPMVAPNTPGKVLLASLASATAPAAILLLSAALGATSPEAPAGYLALYLLFNTGICAGMAYVTSRVVYGYGVRLQRARELGSYRLTERLGSGGMGEVWRAEHRMLARPAAIKLIKPEVLGADEHTRRVLLRRFEREARATASLRSTHTIELYDFGTTEAGVFYYVMELLDGMSLDDLVEQFGPMPPGRAVYLLRQACHSLGEAHERGMIHRDVKPANIYTCRLGPDCDFVKVLDFGLVKTAADLQPDATRLTDVGTAAGTPAFMAPEIALGEGEVDGRADLYALGCVAYWLLTGQPVFEGDTPMAVVLEHVRTPPVPPSRRTELEVPAPLEELVLACLAKRPADRPHSAAELDRRLADLGLEDAWGREAAASWWRLHRPEEVAGTGVPVAGAGDPRQLPAD